MVLQVVVVTVVDLNWSGSAAGTNPCEKPTWILHVSASAPCPCSIGCWPVLHCKMALAPLSASNTQPLIIHSSPPAPEQISITAGRILSILLLKPAIGAAMILSKLDILRSLASVNLLWQRGPSHRVARLARPVEFIARSNPPLSKAKLK